jgi:hypothetical protein
MLFQKRERQIVEMEYRKIWHTEEKTERQMDNETETTEQIKNGMSKQNTKRSQIKRKGNKTKGNLENNDEQGKRQTDNRNYRK